MIKRLLFGIVLCLSFACVSRAQSCTTATCTAATCGLSDIQAAWPTSGNVNATIVVNIPPGTCSWSSASSTALSLTVPAANTSLSLLGAGNLNVLGGGDQTVIVDDTTSTTALLHVTTGAANTTLRIAGITWDMGTGPTKDLSFLQVTGFSQNLRVDHSTFDSTTGSHHEGYGISEGGWLYGVFDHNIHRTLGSVSFAVRLEEGNWGGGANAFGDGSWADPTFLGTNKFIFIEDNDVTNGVMEDCTKGGRAVVRHNTLHAAGFEVHPTGGGGRDRGCRALEIYSNTMISTNNCCSGGTTPYFTGYFWSSGTGIVWNNSAPVGYESMYQLYGARTNPDLGYTEQATPTGWGYCGPGTGPQTGTVNTAGTAVTLVSGPNFSTSWPNTFAVIIINGVTYKISTVASTTALTLGSSAGTQTGVTYITGSVWDGNTNQWGYPCLDQPMRGQSDLLSTAFPNAIDTVGGVPAWPNQKREPLYDWMNVWNQPPGYGPYLAGNAGLFAANSDYYLWCNAASTTGCTTYNGTVGTGSGLLSARPATCTAGPGGNTPGVGYWATDTQTLYVCNPTNTWTTYYTPYVYPHPLVTGSATTTPAPCLPMCLVAVPPPTPPVAVTNVSISPKKTYVSDKGCSQDGVVWDINCPVKLFCTGCSSLTAVTLDGKSVTGVFKIGEIDVNVPLSLLPVPIIETQHTFALTNPTVPVPVLQ